MTDNKIANVVKASRLSVRRKLPRQRKLDGEQVTNGVAVRMAVLYLLAGGTPDNARSAKEEGEA